jgi:hypothetical protein
MTTIGTMLTLTMRMDMAIRMMIALTSNRSTICQAAERNGLRIVRFVYPGYTKRAISNLVLD